MALVALFVNIMFSGDGMLKSSQSASLAAKSVSDALFAALYAPRPGLAELFIASVTAFCTDDGFIKLVAALSR